MKAVTRLLLSALLSTVVPACGTGGSGGGGNGNGGGAPGSPSIASFSASPDTLAAGGGTVTLSWSVTGADSLSIDHGVGTVTGSMTTTSVAASTIFTLTATNSAGSSTLSAAVTVAPSASAPVILSFTATPSVLASPGLSTTLAWNVLNATGLSIDQGVGPVGGTSTSVVVGGTTIYTLTASNGSGSTTAIAAVVVGANPSKDGGRYVAMVSPTGGESFLSPTTLRLIAAAHDPNVYTNSPAPGLGGNASKVQFFVDDTQVLEVDGSNAEYWVFKGFVTGIASGRHRVWARGIFVSPAKVLDSPPMIIDVVSPPAWSSTVSLGADLVLSGSAPYELLGAPGARIRLLGNGHKISGSLSGALTLKHVDVFDLGNRTTTTNAGMDVATSGAVTVEDCSFDTSNTIRIAVSGTAAASVRRNLFRSNMRMPVGQFPGGDPQKPSYPSIVLSGGSTGTKAFAGNNVGAGWVEFNGANHWTVGGDTDADSNVIIGPRVGIYLPGSSSMQVRRNFSHHVYYGGWSQGSNFELGGATTHVIESNVIRGSSWPVRGVGCEFRTNAILDAGHQWLWGDNSNGFIHHNVFAGGEADVGGIMVLYSPTNVRIQNNTFDGQLATSIATFLKLENGSVTLTSNLFTRNSGGTTISIEGGTLTADYNMFFNAQTTNYSDGRHPTHDVANGAQTNPLLAGPPSVPFDLDSVGVWRRTLTTRDVLMNYRARYTPQAGSPAIDAGDPAGGAGNDVGAVGSGAANAADLFGRF